MATSCLMATSFCLAQTNPEQKSYPSTGVNYSLFSADKPPLVPKPQVLEWDNNVQVLKDVCIDMPSQGSDLNQMKWMVSDITSFLRNHDVAIKNNASFVIKFQETKEDISPRKESKIQEESYSLVVTKNGALISASSSKGFFYGWQTLKQLITSRDGKTYVALCSIKDWPDLEIRGLMNDVARNFMPLDLIKEEIDALATLKYNTYHIHLTDNEGWRLESKIYPQLTDPKFQTRNPGEYYTIDQLKELIDHCRVRNVTLIPEIDMPGHSVVFRKALDIKRMDDPKATEALVALIKELCSHAPKEKMPYIHVGTDEVRGGHESVTPAILDQYFAAVSDCGREAIRWQPGQRSPKSASAIQQIWTERLLRHSWPTKGASYIDSHETYLNHIDPQQVAATMYFRRPCPYPDAKGKGFTLCCWVDLPATGERGQVIINPIYGGLAFGSEPLWNNPHPKYEGDPMKDDLLPYFTCLPPQGSDLLKQFAEYENRVLAIRDRFFVDKEFNYVRQANIPWKIIGPFPHEGDVDRVFPPDEIVKTGKIEPSYQYEGKNYEWLPETYTGATVIFKHYCDMPTLFSGDKVGGYPHKNHTYYAMTNIYSPKDQDVPFWVSGHTWATSDWRMGPTSVPGKWFHANPKFFVNGKEIAPPEWAKPNNQGALIDENYQARKPTMISLKKGWNQVLIKSPNNNLTRRWMFTFVPILPNEKTPFANTKEYPGLKFSVKPE